MTSDFRFKEDDELLFAEEPADQTVAEGSFSSAWRMLIVDDEEEVHRVTKLVLKSFTFDGKGLEFFHAYSGAEAKDILERNSDIALILLDVVMETDDAGLEVVKYIRDTLNNKFVRIILRTGQPGQAPENVVIRDYDINDYKAKTELTSQKLFTTVIASLRSYRDIMTIEKNKEGLRKIIDASPHIFKFQPLKTFTDGVLTQMGSILNLDGSMFCHGFTGVEKAEDLSVCSASGKFEENIEARVTDVLNDQRYEMLVRALKERRSVFNESDYFGYLAGQTGTVNLVYLRGTKTLSKWDRDLVDLFLANVSIGFDNIQLNLEIEDTQSEVIYTLGELAEARSKETGQHVKRVAEYSELLALEYGFSEPEARIMKLASPMHDVGKLGIPDVILNKPGRHTPAEWEIMKQHAIIGYEMLKHSKRKILKAAAITAGQHHEKWDGSGYPFGLKGEDIHIFGRITAVADVFDALSCKRVYKGAWEIDRIVDYFRQERGKHFEPRLVDIFLDNLDRFVEILEENSENWERAR